MTPQDWDHCTVEERDHLLDWLDEWVRRNRDENGTQ